MIKHMIIIAALYLNVRFHLRYVHTQLHIDFIQKNMLSVLLGICIHLHALHPCVIFAWIFRRQAKRNVTHKSKNFYLSFGESMVRQWLGYYF